MAGVKKSGVVRWYHARGDAWFVPKYFGFGATPVTWQGWLSVFVFAAIEFAIVTLVPAPVWLRVFLALIAMVPFITLVVAKTDGAWRFRWGGGSKD